MHLAIFKQKPGIKKMFIFLKSLEAKNLKIHSKIDIIEKKKIFLHIYKTFEITLDIFFFCNKQKKLIWHALLFEQLVRIKFFKLIIIISFSNSNNRK